MKVAGFNCSARKDGNTAILLNTALEEVKMHGINTEMIQLAGHKISGCKACYKCFENKDKKCVIKDDIVNECIAKMAEADGILIGSPVYFSNITPEAVALICRAGMVARANDMMLSRKIGAAVVAVRRTGAMHAFSSINHFFTILEMIIVSSNYWNVGFGRQPGEVSSDEEGIATIKRLGVNMSWLIKKLYGDKCK